MKVTPLSQVGNVEKIPSGIFVFDLLTAGGIPTGRYTLLWGAKGTGKTSFAIRVASNFLKKYPERQVLFVDFEQAITKDWAQDILATIFDGVCTDSFLVIQPGFAEEGIDTLIEILDSDDYDVGLVVVDSIAMMIPLGDAESEASQDSVGTLARAANKMFRKLTPRMARQKEVGKPLTVILINQQRTKIERSFVPSYTLPGGMLQGFLASLEVRFWRDGIAKKSIDGEEIPISVSYTFSLEKTKTGGIPSIAGKYKMALVEHGGYRRGEVIEDNVIIDLLKKYGLLKKDGGKWVIEGIEEKFKTQVEIKERMKNESAFKEKIKNKVSKAFYMKVRGGNNGL